MGSPQRSGAIVAEERVPVVSVTGAERVGIWVRTRPKDRNNRPEILLFETAKNAVCLPLTSRMAEGGRKQFSIFAGRTFCAGRLSLNRG